VIALLALAVLPRCADSFHLRWGAATQHLSPQRVEAVARVESGCNLSPLLRAHACWNRVVRLRDCEVGRFQIKPSTARARCRGLNVFTYSGNVACFFRMFGEDWARGGRTYATLRHNGSGPGAEHYLALVDRAEDHL